MLQLSADLLKAMARRPHKKIKYIVTDIWSTTANICSGGGGRGGGGGRKWPVRGGGGKGGEGTWRN